MDGRAGDEDAFRLHAVAAPGLVQVDIFREVLAEDAYSKFEENGIFDRKTGDLFRKCILSVGGSCDPMEAFVAFRGRKPTIDALLRHTGITYVKK